MKRTYSLVIITLSVSLIIYLVYRTEKTLINELILLFVSADTFAEIRSSVKQSLPLSESIVFSLPGGLWVFCSTIVSKEFYIRIANYRIAIAAIPILFAAGLEICQFFHLTNGTFDRWDIAFYFAFWWLGSSKFQPPETEPRTLSPFTFRGFICLALFLSVYLAHVNL